MFSHCEDHQMLSVHALDQILGVRLEVRLLRVQLLLLMLEKQAQHHQGGKIYVYPVFLLPFSRDHPGEDPEVLIYCWQECQEASCQLHYNVVHINIFPRLGGNMLGLHVPTVLPDRNNLGLCVLQVGDSLLFFVLLYGGSCVLTFLWDRDSCVLIFSDEDSLMLVDMPVVFIRLYIL